MNPDAPIPIVKPPPVVWWVIWGAILVGLGAIYVAFGRRPLPAELPPEQSLTGLVGLAPLFVSVILRWLAFPRVREPQKAFAWFIVGVALAEACGILGIFLGGPYRDDLFVLGVLGVVQWIPLVAGNLGRPPAGSGFRPE
jgi:hypothetical protein